MILKSHDHASESHDKFKNSLLKITQRTWQITFGHFFVGCVIFVRNHFLWLHVEHLSCASVIGPDIFKWI